MSGRARAPHRRRPGAPRRRPPGLPAAREEARRLGQRARRAIGCGGGRRAAAGPADGGRGWPRGAVAGGAPDRARRDRDRRRSWRSRGLDAPEFVGAAHSPPPRGAEWKLSIEVLSCLLWPDETDNSRRTVCGVVAGGHRGEGAGDRGRLRPEVRARLRHRRSDRPIRQVVDRRRRTRSTSASASGATASTTVASDNGTRLRRYGYNNGTFNMDYLWQSNIVRGQAQLDWHVGAGGRASGGAIAPATASR